MAPGSLEQALEGLEFGGDPDLLVGLEQIDDAGVYRVSPELALIQTVDFFTPIVDDPFDFGRIAAVNALSDVYAMGGVPRTALNLVGFPVKKMEIRVLREILRGGLEVLKEAGVLLMGGHSVEDDELKYGLAVTGFVHPRKFFTKQGVRPGDALVLTKPLGTGMLGTAVKAGLAPPEAVEAMTRSMVTLNREAADAAKAFDVHACTDVTGFGLLGHLAEMIAGTSVGVEIRASAPEILPFAEEAARMGLVPGGCYANKEFRSCMVDVDPSVPPERVDLLYDPQTSGGLLLALPADQAGPYVQALAREGGRAVTIGRAFQGLNIRVVPGP